MSFLWHAEDIVRATRAVTLHELTWSATGIATDSKTVQKGDLYIALDNDQKSSTAYEAFARGAVAVLASRMPTDVPPYAHVLRVASLEESLYRFGAASLERSTASKIAIVGKAGNTTELLRFVLEASGKTYTADNDVDAPFHLPLSLARLPQDAKWGVFPLWAGDAEKIAPQIVLLMPDAGDARALCSTLPKNGAVVIDGDNPLCGAIALAAKKSGVRRVLRFGQDSKCDARLISFERTEGGSIIEACILGQDFRLPLATHTLETARHALAALLTAAAADADILTGADNLAAWREAVPQAAQAKAQTLYTYTIPLAPGGRCLMLDGTEGATLESTKSALAQLGAKDKDHRGRKIAVLGDLMELGPNSARIHAQLVNDIQKNGIDLVYGCGPMMAHLIGILPAALRGAWQATSRDLAPLVAATVKADDCILVIGSVAAQMEAIVDELDASSQVLEQKRAS